ncbi:Transposase [Jannaschia donghaensis]|uniref:Transposase n=1 Tax=Jannaschia donghaensis TaxID=420998 RepID=A0A0M6YN21_9RHOB|nr:Transposase [Jannaschia donghaensis]
MSDLYWLSEGQTERLRPYFPNSLGVPRVDDRRVLSGIVFVNCNGLRGRDAPRAYGPQKTLYNRWKRWSDTGVFARIMTGLAARASDNKTISIPSRDITA